MKVKYDKKGNIILAADRFLHSGEMVKPVLDGHTWVSRDGVIIDPWFKDYERVCMERGVTMERHYVAAPKHVQHNILTMFKYYWILEKKNHTAVKHNYCQYNSFLEAENNGGEVIFGSMGFGTAPNIFWEFGDPLWKKDGKFIIRL